MNAKTAQSLLRCYRSGKTGDSRMEKAMRFADEDPELRKALDEQIAFDEQIIGAIHFIKPPDDLRKKLTDLGGETNGEKTRLRSQVINPAIMTAIFGVVVLLGCVVFIVMERMEKFPGRDAVENMLSAAGKMSGGELEPASGNAGQLGDWLYMHGYDGYEAPVELSALPVTGSRVFRMDGQPIAQLLIGNGDPASPEGIRCLIFEFHASEFGVQLPSDAGWKVLGFGEWVGAIKQHGDHCFLITFRGSKSDMQDFLKTLPTK